MTDDAAQRGGDGRATRRRCTATWATSARTPPSATRSADVGEGRRQAPVGQSSAPRRPVASRSCASATSSGSRRAGAPGTPSSCRPTRAASGEPPSPAVVTEDRQLRRLTLVDVPEPVEPITDRQAAQELQRRSPEVAPRPRHLAADRRAPRPAVRGAAAGPTRIPRSPSGSRSCAGSCARTRATRAPTARTHARWAERWWRLKRETVGLQRKVEGRTNSVARTFDRICDPLEDLRLPRRRRAPSSPRGASGCAGSTPRRTCWPPSACATTCGSGSTRRAWPPPCRRWSTSPGTRRPRSQPADAERATSPRPWPEMVAAVVRDRGPRARARPAVDRRSRTAGWPGWCTAGPSGDRLEAVLRGQDMAAGDFVRRCKQIVDLLDQVADAAAPTAAPLASTARLGGRRGAAGRRGRGPNRLTRGYTDPAAVR